MARKNASESETTAAAAGIGDVPDGFQRLGSVANAGWMLDSEVGNTCRGILLGQFKKPDGFKEGEQQDFFQIRITEPCRVRVGRGEAVEMVDAQAGEVVNVNYGPKTKDLGTLIPDQRRGAVFEVIVKVVGGKLGLSKGRTMKNIDVMSRMVSAPKASADDVDFTGSAGATAADAS